MFTDRVFAPAGVSLTWTAVIRGPALVMWPITKAFGSLVSYNLLMLLAPALAAWAAYLVCNRLTHAFWPSVVGGYLFGFSTYMIGQQASHVNLVLMFPVPLAVYLVVRRLEGSLGLIAFWGWLFLTLLALFSISTELFATTALFGGIAFLLALAFGTDRGAVLRTIESPAPPSSRSSRCCSCRTCCRPSATRRPIPSVRSGRPLRTGSAPSCRARTS